MNNKMVEPGTMFYFDKDVAPTVFLSYDIKNNKNVMTFYCFETGDYQTVYEHLNLKRLLNKYRFTLSPD